MKYLNKKIENAHSHWDSIAEAGYYEGLGALTVGRVGLDAALRAC